MLSDFLSPSPCNDVIPMQGQVDFNLLIDAFIMNLMHSRIEITTANWRDVIHMFDGNDDNPSRRVALQLLFIFSQVDTVELERNMHCDCSTNTIAYVIPAFVSRCSSTVGYF